MQGHRQGHDRHWGWLSGLPLRGLDFHGSQLATFEKDGERWVALRPVVEGMGLSWGGQRDKLEANGERFNRTDIRTVGADGRQREMACIPLRRYRSAVEPQPVEEDVDRVGLIGRPRRRCGRRRRLPVSYGCRQHPVRQGGLEQARPALSQHVPPQCLDPPQSLC
jgi:hypothetical protein